MKAMDSRIEKSILLEPLETSVGEYAEDNQVAVICERMERKEIGRLVY